MIVTRKENVIRVEKGELKLEAFRTDPYGFWEVRGFKGKQKLDLSGKFTSISDVKNELKRIVNDQIPVDKQELEAISA